MTTTPNKNRTKVPPDIDAAVVYMSDFKCCICQKKGDHTHHLDGNKNNNKIENLALLCFDHHNLAGLKNNLSKKLSKQAILKYREHYYQVVANERQRALGTLDSPIKEITEEKLLTISKNAVIIIELDKIKSQFYEENWKKRSETISQINIHLDHNNNRLAYDVIRFLSHVASMTRSGMTYDAALSLHMTLLNFCPGLHDAENREQTIEIAKMCIHLGDNIAYDSFIHLRNLAVASCGLTIIKFIHREATQNKIQELIDLVSQTYKELEETLRRPERTDLGNAQELLKIFKDDLTTWDLAFPMFPDHLMKIFNAETREV